VRIQCGPKTAYIVAFLPYTGSKKVETAGGKIKKDKVS
jgi:hypothetical protein